MASVDSTSDDRTTNNTMRHKYRVLNDAEKANMQSIKDAGLAFHDQIAGLGNSREISLAKTKVEEAVMWAVKHITAGFVLVAVLMLLSAPAGAAEKTKAVSLTVEQAVNMHCVLNANKDNNRQPTCNNIETYDDVIKEGDRERVVTRRYQFKPGVLSAMAKNILALRYVTEKFERERALLQEKVLVTQPLGPSASTDDATVNLRAREKEFAEYTKQAREMLSAKIDFNLYAFSDAELDLAKNAIPASVLAILDPIRE